MENRKSRALLVVAAFYLISQAVLVATVGKNLELILLSLGVFLAIAAIIFAVDFSSVNVGRPLVESVSMRRAKRSKEDQAQLLRDGYVIDDDFLKPKRFEFSQPKPNHHFSSAASSIAPTDDSSETQEPTPKEKLQTALISQAPMFGGIEKLSQTLGGMDNATIEKMLKRMGYKGVSGDEVRVMVAELLDKEKNPPPQAEKNMSSHPQTSLDMVSFYDYIKRCMSGHDQETLKLGPPPIMGDEILAQISTMQNGEMSPRALARMRGVHKGGGLRKCVKCQSHDAQAGLCNALGIPVQHNDVCDNWRSAAFEMQ